MEKYGIKVQLGIDEDAEYVWLMEDDVNIWSMDMNVLLFPSERAAQQHAREEHLENYKVEVFKPVVLKSARENPLNSIRHETIGEKVKGFFKNLMKKNG